ncbi:Hypothetical protein NCS54_00319600 [Fusarium falciforme]|uniref:Phytanoyl-CoA dioxygenase n=1 Tax=Fusarium falciforme TaxID=195108 RepID=A0A9W8UXH9_9HYPO|nr:Hypothetical protein NCS54_00319600 [Fusarium falciforme]KAJ4183913.1 hypothetical protein NW755_009452 [Fusarium falciforme]WAO85942.1 Hypothetical protein NCS54_00319600 [Fusarium falciforme]
MTDWYQHYLDNGYAVVPNVIPKEKALAYQRAAFDWLKSFGNDALDLSDRSTWTPDNLPNISNFNAFTHYGVVHEKFMWDIRLEPGIIDVFEKIWGTRELLVSFDALNITLPRRPGHVPRQPQAHVDQSPYRQGLQCVQGIACFSKSGPEDGGLTVYPGTHKVVEDFFANYTSKADWRRKDFYTFTEDHIAWFEDQGYRPHKVTAEPGDLIIWDSRLIHWGAEPTPEGNTIRTITYVSYTPAYLASAETLEKKKEAFDKWLATTHWPHDNINIRASKPKLPDGTLDTRRSEPREKPELTDELLKLAGVKPYGDSE